MNGECRLYELKPGQRAKIMEIYAGGSIRRRFFDLGLAAGTQVECVAKSPAGDPSAYLIRGAVIAIRKEDSREILVQGLPDNRAIPQQGVEGSDGQVGKQRQPLIALAGNPNVGKSSVFNGLTGLRQHTGNWPGKTVASARGRLVTASHTYELVDLPGTYSLLAHSQEEEVASSFLCFGEAEAVIVICDATCLERNLNLALQIMEAKEQVILCINMMDEAKKKQIQIDIRELTKGLGIPVVGVTARRKESLAGLTQVLDELVEGKLKSQPTVLSYDEAVEKAITEMEACLEEILVKPGACKEEFFPASIREKRWISLKLLEKDKTLLKEAGAFFQWDASLTEQLQAAAERTLAMLKEQGISQQEVRDRIAAAPIKKAEELCKKAVVFRKPDYNSMDRRLDKLFTSRWFGYPTMLLLLALVFWITIKAANYPSQLLSGVLFGFQEYLTELFVRLGAPDWLHGLLVLGMYRVLAWVISVMLPPMAIFFPLFTLLEDAGYLPRAAFNLDHSLSRCRACGKQALTMTMGFGCNAAAVMGCRIIDSPRERLIAILTNNFVPCNGRFPTLIMLISMFFAGSVSGILNSVTSTLLLMLVIVLGISMTFFMSWLLSHTILKGVPSGFTLELPSYRKPQVGKVIVRSILDRTLFVLGRAVAVAAPAGMVIWLMANVTVDGGTILNHCAGWLDPLGRLLGLDGVILMAFLLGIPANEIVIPIIIMAYLAQGQIVELNRLWELKALLLENGWTPVTALCTMVFSLMHWPCSTTLVTIKKETGSTGWMLLGFLLPTAAGMLCCLFIRGVATLLGMP